MKFSLTSFTVQFIKVVAFIFFMICINDSAHGSLGVAVSNSNWTSASTWSFNGVNRLPNCSDSISIGSSYTVTVNSQVDYTACSGPMIIYVYGILQFTNGNKLDLPCGSVVFIMAGGLIKKSTAGGGSSTLISICGITEWKAGDGPLSGIDTLGNVTTLPVELINFEADKDNGSVKLTWSTATEVNNEYFTLERSNDAKHFIEIEKILGAGNSSFQNSYSFYDNEPLEGVSYYRLSQTDFDGKRVIFPLVAIRNLNSANKDILILKNPFTSSIVFSTTQIRSGEMQVSLFTGDGRNVFQENRISNENSVYSIDNLGELSSGFYFLQIKKNGQIIHSSGVVKQ